MNLKQWSWIILWCEILIGCICGIVAYLSGNGFNEFMIIYAGTNAMMGIVLGIILLGLAVCIVFEKLGRL